MDGRYKMKAKDAIKYLSDLDPEESVVIAWWTKDMFALGETDEETSKSEWTDEEWEWAARRLNDKMDWSYVHEFCSAGLDVYIDEFRERPPEVVGGEK
jgi:hypothetical protein